MVGTLCVLSGAHTPDWMRYVGYVRGVLGWDVADIRTDAPAERLHVCDLVLLHRAQSSWWRRLLPGNPERRLVDRLPASLLLVQQPRQPLEHILLVLRGDETDAPAITWTVRLARPTGALVSVLPIVPPYPRAYTRRAGQLTAEVILATNTPSGAELHSLADDLSRREVSFRIRLGAGLPDEQIRREVARSDPDLLILAAEPHGRLHRLLLGELVGPLLGWIQRPLLIAKPNR